LRSGIILAYSSLRRKKLQAGIGILQFFYSSKYILSAVHFHDDRLVLLVGWMIAIKPLGDLRLLFPKIHSPLVRTGVKILSNP